MDNNMDSNYIKGKNDCGICFYEILRLQREYINANNCKLIIIDPKSDYKKLIKEKNDFYKNFNANKLTKVNPFELKELIDLKENKE